MNIIILSGANATPKNIDLRTWQGRLGLGSVAAGGALFFVLMGLGLGWVFANPSDLQLREVHAMRATLVQQRTALLNIDSDAHRNLDALALQMGQLQAQATRLNALGERLTEVGKLDDGEFNFDQVPALGGPEEPVDGSGTLLVKRLPLNTGIEQMRAEFDRQEAQLGILEDLLLDRKVEDALRPAGWPVAQGYIASGYGERADPINGHEAAHTGIDFDAAAGSDILAVAEGVVSWSGDRPGYGNVVEVDHGNGYMTRYAHNSKNIAQVGQRVHAGEVIAEVGSTGRATGSHCHFEVWLNGKAVNPIAYVRSSRAKRT